MYSEDEPQQTIANSSALLSIIQGGVAMNPGLLPKLWTAVSKCHCKTHTHTQTPAALCVWLLPLLVLSFLP